MGFISVHIIVILSWLSFFFPNSASDQDYRQLVYKVCAKQVFQDPVYSDRLLSLFLNLVFESKTSTFFKTSVGKGPSSINGLFQCTENLGNTNCYNCVSQLPTLLTQLCGKTKAARVQVKGCYMWYEVNGFPRISGTQMVHKTCGSTYIRGNRFTKKRDYALGLLVEGLRHDSRDHRFYSFVLEGLMPVLVLAQCQGDLGDSDCEDCVKSAIKRPQVECENSTSGQIYLDKCFIIYSYYPSGLAGVSLSEQSRAASWTTAAAIGGVAGGILILFLCLIVVRKLKKIHDRRPNL